MTFKCKNCGGYMVFSPERQQMYCSFCEGLDCEYETGDKSLTTCASCGGEITVGQFVSASKCPFCGNYLIFDERVRNEFKPDEIIPFKLGKKQAVEAMEKEFKKRIFTPISFLSERTLGDMEGRYVPFFLYDFKARGVFNGTGTKVRRWREGNYDCTETSYYDVERVMDVDYDNVPADASEEMPDYKMDLVEPYQYEALTSFDPRYLSGFFGEIYNNTADAYAERAREKAKNSAGQLLREVFGILAVAPVKDADRLSAERFADMIEIPGRDFGSRFACVIGGFGDDRNCCFVRRPRSAGESRKGEQRRNQNKQCGFEIPIHF